MTTITITGHFCSHDDLLFYRRLRNIFVERLWEIAKVFVKLGKHTCDKRYMSITTIPINIRTECEIEISFKIKKDTVDVVIISHGDKYAKRLTHKTLLENTPIAEAIIEHHIIPFAVCGNVILQHTKQKQLRTNIDGFDTSYYFVVKTLGTLYMNI